MGTINKLLAVLPQDPTQSILKLSAKQALSSITNSSLPAYMTIVSGHAHTDVQKELESLPVKCVYNPLAESGISSSIQTGLHCLLQQSLSDNKYLDFIIVCLADMPHVQSATISQLANTRTNNTAHEFIVPVFLGQRGNPVLIGHAFFDAINTLTGDVGARRLIQQHPESTLELVVADAGVIKDYDVPSDLS